MKNVFRPWGGLILVLGCYVALYGGLLWYTHGLPYVLDNNESFSSLWHAYNLYYFDISKSMGLADETFAYHAAAHPFVHTHQGNFPRLFAFLIFALGATSVQSQIVVTTFTVGLAGVVLAYVFFSRIADPLLATIFCLLLITDYVLVAQWQVVTYRVWHLFFVFSSLLCVHLLARKKALGIALTVLNFACLFYYELVFVFFVSLSCALYAAVYLRKRWADVAMFWASQALGAVIALGVLVTQLTLYMGWEDALRDFRFTFLGRNYLSNSEGIARSSFEFYDSHNIAFWYNLEDGAQFRSIQNFLGSLTHFELQVHTPLFTTICLVLVFGMALGAWCLLSNRREDPTATSTVFAPSIILSAPFLVTVLVCLLHLYSEQYRGSFGTLEAITLASVVGSVLAALLVTRSIRRRLQKDGRESRAAWTRVTFWFCFFALMGALPSVVNHWSSTRILLDRYSAFFVAYLLLFVMLLSWVGWNLLATSRTDRWRHWARITVRLLPRSAILGLLLVSCYALASVVLSGNLAFGLPITSASAEMLSPYAAIVGGSMGLTLFALFGELGAPSAAALRRMFLPPPERTRTLLLVAAYLSLITALIAISPYFYNQYEHNYGPIWLEIANGSLGRPVALLAFFCAVIVSCAFAFRYPVMRAWPRCIQAVRGLGPFLAVGLTAYTVTFFVAPAYIFTGYRYRAAPFTVFHTTALAAVAVYGIVCAIAHRSSSRQESERSGTNTGIELRRFDKAQATSTIGFPEELRWLSVGVLAALGVYWFGMQITYVRSLPPRHYSFLDRLSEPPFRGATFVVNGYAGPIAAATHSWAYLDVNLLRNELVISTGTNELALDTKYLWFADRLSNPTYRTPDYFICVTAQTLNSMAEAASRRAGAPRRWNGCETHQLVRIARGLEPNTFDPKVSLAAVDTEGPAQVGYERWAIVKLTWKHAASEP